MGIVVDNIYNGLWHPRIKFFFRDEHFGYNDLRHQIIKGKLNPGQYKVLVLLIGRSDFKAHDRSFISTLRDFVGFLIREFPTLYILVGTPVVYVSDSSNFRRRCLGLYECVAEMCRVETHRGRLEPIGIVFALMKGVTEEGNDKVSKHGLTDEGKRVFLDRLWSKISSCRAFDRQAVLHDLHSL